MTASCRLGLISDTHGLLRPEALQALAGVEHILHAGDIGRGDVLDGLQALAPVTAIRGNNDTGGWAAGIPETRYADFAGVRFYLLHDLKALDIDPRAEGVRVIVSGHSHKPAVELRNGVLFVNPGSAGPRRFKLPVTVATLEIAHGRPAARIVTLDLS